MRTFISVEDARDEVLASCPPMPSEEIEWSKALGRTLAVDVEADGDHPGFDNSAVDGYAVSAEDLGKGPIELALEGEVQAGQVAASGVRQGSCWRIMTGAPVPDGTAAVVPLEATSGDDDRTVRIESVPDVGGNIRRRGQDVKAGELVLPAGTRIGAAASGLLAMFGRVRVPVARRPSVAVVSTGNELVPPGDQPGPGQLRNSNATALAAQAEEAGGVVIGTFHARDSADAIDAIIARVRSADLVVFTGGVSVGRYDLVHEALIRAGFVTSFWKVRQRPGKPLLFGMLGNTPVVGLPGNPVSSSVCFDQYVRPALLRMSGRRNVLRDRYSVRLAEPFPKPEGLHVFARGIAAPGPEGSLVVRPTGAQGSHVFSSVLRANCLVHLPAGWSSAPAGSYAELEWIDW